MSRPRIDVQTAFESAMTLSGYTPHVYYQPPESIKLVYPCIVYNRERYRTDKANNDVYKEMTQYSVTVMDKNPDSKIVENLRALQYCELSQQYRTENIYHYIFNYFY